MLIGLLHVTTGTAGDEDEAGKHNFTVETARIEQVLSVEDDGFRSSVYVVSWKGKLVGVTDPLSQTHHQVGDQVKMMVMRWQAPDNSQLKVLNFTLADPPPKRAR